MMRYGEKFEAERKARAVYVLDTTRYFLEQSHVQRRLGSRAAALTEVMNLFEVPDVVNGVVMDLPEFRDREVIPFVLARTGEKLTHSMSRQTPTQQVGIERAIDDYGLDLGDDDDSQSNGGERPSYARTDSVHRTAEAETWCGMIFSIPGDEHDRQLWLASRPIVAMRNRLGLERAVPALVHEGSHVVDYIERPLELCLQEDFSLETELRAYSAGAVVMETLYGRGVESISNKIERIRRRHNGSRFSPQAFVPREEIKRSLAENRLSYVYAAGR